MTDLYINVYSDVASAEGTAQGAVRLDKIVSRHKLDVNSDSTSVSLTGVGNAGTYNYITGYLNGAGTDIYINFTGATTLDTTNTVRIRSGSSISGCFVGAVTIKALQCS